MFGLAELSISHIKLMDVANKLFHEHSHTSPWSGEVGTYSEGGIHWKTFWKLIFLLRQGHLPYKLLRELTSERRIPGREHRSNPRYEITGYKGCGYVVVDTSTRQVI
jgi:hypothetical protein